MCSNEDFHDEFRQLESENQMFLQHLREDENVTNFRKETLPLAGSTSAINEYQSQTTSNFLFYKKRPGTNDSGKEFECMMCSLYALKFCTNETIKDFKITANNVLYGDFDDISLEVTFNDQTTKIFVMQLKHKENKKARVTDTDLSSPKSDFSLEKYLKSFESLDNDNITCIFYTNRSANMKNNFSFFIPKKGATQNKTDEQLQDASSNNTLQADVLVKVPCLPDYINILTNSNNNRQQQCSSSVFQFEITQTKQIFRKVNQFCKQFYFFANQDNINTVKSSVRKFLYNLLQCDIYDSFIFFMKEWWSGRFYLTKHDVIVKLVELAVSPWIRSISGSKRTDKSEFLARTIMRFEMTIVKDCEDNVAENIWDHSFIELEKNKCEVVAKKYRIEEEDACVRNSKILWYLDVVPFIIKIREENVTQVKSAIKLLENDVRKNKKRLLLLGEIITENFSKWSIFENLSDLLKVNNEDYGEIIDSFQLSIQGREFIFLKQLMTGDDLEQMRMIIETKELLKMSQEILIVGEQEEKLNELHIPRTISITLLNTNEFLECCIGGERCVIIVNLDERIEYKFDEEKVTVMKLARYLELQNPSISKTKILLSQEKCTNAQFQKVFENKNVHNIYLIQIYDIENCILLLKEENTAMLAKIRRKQLFIDETEIFQYVSNSVKTLCAPPGMGKSRLSQVLSKNCPPEYCSFRVNLINHNSFLKSKPDNLKLLNHFLKLDQADESFFSKLTRIYLCNKKIHLFLDGLDEVDSEHCEFLLNFVKQVSSEGISVWVISRENLRDKISKFQYTVSLELLDLKLEEQKKYIQRRLEPVYQNEEIEKIICAIFRSTDVTNSQLLLGIPLQLYIITENFVNSKKTYEHMNEENIFVLTKMYQQFFEGKKKNHYEKIGLLDNEEQIGFDLKLLLTFYEIPALMTCLDRKDFCVLKLDTSDSQTFINRIKERGDKLGIVKLVNEDEQAVFDHQTYAEYFACLWLKKHKDKALLLREEIFSQRYENLKLIFDIILADESPLHLAVIYKNMEQFKKHFDKINEKDQGGRTVLHLACSHGMKYPLDYDLLNRMNRESQFYMTIIETLLSKSRNITERDDLFNFTCLDYLILSKCLFPLEKMLEMKLLTRDQIDKILCEYNNNQIIVFHACQTGYLNLASVVIDRCPNFLIHTNFDDFALLHIAILGRKDDIYTVPRQGNIAVVQMLLTERVLVEEALQYAWANRCYDVMKLLTDFTENSILDLMTQCNMLNEYGINFIKQKDKDINVQSALQFAIQMGSEEKVEKLIQLGADVKMMDNNMMNALHHIISKAEKRITTGYNLYNRFPVFEIVNGMKMVNFLIKKGIDVNTQIKSGLTVLHLTCRAGLLENTRQLIELGADLNLVDNDNHNALHWACMSTEDNTRIIDLLVKSGIEINAQDKTALHVATETGNLRNIQKLIELGADLNAVDNNTWNALHYASFQNVDNSEIIEFLISSGMDVDVPIDEGTTALLSACRFGTFENVEKLVACGAILTAINNIGANALHYASEKREDNRETIQFLVSSGIDIDERDHYGITTLMRASKVGIDINVKLLIGLGADINAVNSANCNALHFASGTDKDNTRTIELLIKCGININAQSQNGATVLLYACYFGTFSNARHLIARGANLAAVDNTGSNALHYASQAKDNTKLINLLLRSGIDVNVRNGDGATALLIACRYSAFDIVQKLMTYGADLSAVDDENGNALHYASFAVKDNTKTIDFLIKSGIDVNSRCEKSTAFLTACQCSTIGNIKRLIQHGADVNVDNDDANALQCASFSREDRREVINYLLTLGFDVNAQDRNGATAFHYACRKRNIANIIELVKNGAILDIVDNKNFDAFDYLSHDENTELQLINSADLR